MGLIYFSNQLISGPKKILPNPVHHSTIQKNTTKYHPQNEESDHPKNLAKDQEMRKNIRNAHFKTTFKVCIDYTSRSKIISIFSLLCYNSLNWHCCILNKTKKWSLKFLTNLQTDLPLFLNEKKKE